MRSQQSRVSGPLLESPRQHTGTRYIKFGTEPLIRANTRWSIHQMSVNFLTNDAWQCTWEEISTKIIRIVINETHLAIIT